MHMRMDSALLQPYFQICDLGGSKSTFLILSRSTNHVYKQIFIEGEVGKYSAYNKTFPILFEM